MLRELFMKDLGRDEIAESFSKSIVEPIHVKFKHSVWQ